MVRGERNSKHGVFQIFDWVEEAQAQGFWSPKWKANRSSGDILLSHCPISGNRRLELDEESGKLLLHIPKNRADLNGSRQKLE